MKFLPVKSHYEQWNPCEIFCLISYIEIEYLFEHEYPSYLIELKIILFLHCGQTMYFCLYPNPDGIFVAKCFSIFSSLTSSFSSYCNNAPHFTHFILFNVPGTKILIIFFSFLPVLHLALDHLCYILTFLFYSMSLTEQLAFEDISASGTLVFDFFSCYLHYSSP
nr:MAG TPA: hypothetical protein [Caudoviricetes sp.]